MSEQARQYRDMAKTASWVMVSRVLGLFRDQLTAAVFGASAVGAAFLFAFQIPNLFRRLLGEGALTAAFVPTLQEELRARQRAGAFALVNQVASWLFLVSGGVVLLSMLLLWRLPRWLEGTAAAAPDPLTLRRWFDAADLAVILFPYLVCVSLAAVFSAALQTLNRFLEPALSPIWLNLAMIGALAGGAYGGWAASAEGAMLWLCGGALLGGVLQMAVPAAALMREGWRPRFDFSAGDSFRQIVRLMGPTVFGSAIYLINISVSRFIGLSLNESAVAMLNLATRLMELPIGVFTVAVSTVIFPLIARHAAAGDWAQLGIAYRKGLRLILVINLPAAVGLMALATPIIRVLFERGAFAASDTAEMRPVLVVFALGLPFLSFVNIVLRAFYAQKDTVTPVRAALLSFVVNLGLSLVLMRLWDTVGLAIASNVATAVQAIYLQACLARKQGALGFGHVARDLGKVLLASAAMGAVIIAAQLGWERHAPAGVWADLAGLLGLIGLGVLVYGALLWWLRIEGREDLAAVLSRVRAKLG